MQAINRDELKAMENNHEDFVLINVLGADQFNKEHIRTSVNVPVGDDDFVEQVETVAGNKDRNVVVYCANFDCNASPKAAEKLDAAGFTRVYDYEGGTQDWMEAKKAS